MRPIGIEKSHKQLSCDKPPHRPTFHVKFHLGISNRVANIH